MKTNQGNLNHLAQNGEVDFIFHGCNCFSTMGAEVAKGIKAAFRGLCRPGGASNVFSLEPGGVK